MPTNFFKKLKRLFIASGIRHFLLILVYFAYLLTFATILRYVERPVAILNYRRRLHQVALQRHRFVTHEIFPLIFNNTNLLLFVHGDKSRKLSHILHASLANYVKLRCPASLETSNLFTNIYQWLLFAFSSTTTLGHTNFIVQSVKGKIIVLIFSLVGIQLTLLVVSDLAFGLKKFILRQQKIWGLIFGWFLCCILPKRPNNRLPENQQKCIKSELSLSLLLFLQILWIFMGSLLFLEFNFMNGMSTLDLVIQCINALTTTGLGQLSRNATPIFTIILIIYLLIGFALMSLIFNNLNLKICILRLHSTKPNIVAKETKNQKFGDEDRRTLMCRDETFEELTEENGFDESIIQSYHTIGIFQVESPTKNSKLIESQEMGTQTDPNVDYYSTIYPRIRKEENPIDERLQNFQSKIPHRYSFSDHISHDDVQSLVRETYRPKSTVQQ